MNKKPSSFTTAQLHVAAAIILATAGFQTTAGAQNGYYATAYRGPVQNASYAAYAQQVAYQQQMAAYQQQMAVYQQQLTAYHQQKAAYDRAMSQQAAARPVAAVPAARPVQNAALRFDGRQAAAPSTAPVQVKYAVGAANSIQNKPYRRGGGHGSVEDNAYDCSGSVSYVLIKAGLLRSPLPSSGFASYGLPGPGRYITIYVKPGEHVFMTVCGLRMDTSGGHDDEGPRWRAKPRTADGFIMRHPAGF
ncbi:MAG: hypothetical protein K1X78_27615 [Verrucomicrobiaceae bacterium]|nr:hypothetical protein [Verrucomicrobiaceae bacterium]